MATITASESGRVDIDKGLIDGLRIGDRGQVHYTIKVDGIERTIDNGAVRVIEVDDFAARAQILGAGSPKPGFQVIFAEIEERQTPAELLRIASRRFDEGRLQVARRYFEKLRSLFPDDPLVLRRLQEIDQSRRSETERTQDSRSINYYLLAAQNSADDGDLETALEYCERVLTLDPDESTARELQEILLRRLRRKSMYQVEAGKKQIGLPRDEARFYNEQPRHEVDLPAFWIDRTPVGMREFQSVMGRGDAVDPQLLTGPAINVTFREAARFCAAVGKRLPTEFEWEVSAVFDSFTPAEVLEWTDSWYQPYPGNLQPEREYGTRYRVIRGYGADQRFDLYFRSFMAADERAPEVGFRCAETESP